MSGDRFYDLHNAILEQDERDAKFRADLRRRAQMERTRAAGYVAPPKPEPSESIGALIGELDWTCELFFIDREEASLP